jgi:ankyrin repeat protein
MAASRGHLDLINKLLAMGADIEAKNEKVHTGHATPLIPTLLFMRALTAGNLAARYIRGLAAYGMDLAATVSPYHHPHIRAPLPHTR